MSDPRRAPSAAGIWRSNVRHLVVLFVTVWIAAVSGATSANRHPWQAGDLPRELTDAIAYYATLTSYADTGTVVSEVPGIVDTARSATYFRRPTRDLYLELQRVDSVNPDTKFRIDMSASRLLIWMFKGEMERYDFQSRRRETISQEGGRQVAALQNAAHATMGISTLIPALLYSKAQLPGAVSQIAEAALAGVEMVDNRRCHKVVGIAAAYYKSGQRTDVRPVTVWIDTETRLIRKVFEDTPEAFPKGSYQRKTITLQPQANPALDDARFQVRIPE